MKIEHVFRIDLTARERQTVELALWWMIQSAGNEFQVKRATALYDKFVDDAQRKRTGGRK